MQVFSKALLLISLLIAVPFTACQKDEPAVPAPVCEDEETGPVHTLQTARAAWAARRQPDYSFNQRWSCECGPALHSTVRVTVRNNQVTGVARLDNGVPVPRDEWQYFLTVDELFRRIEGLEASNPYQLSVEYSPKYGYPTLTLLDQFADENVVDDINAVHAGCLSFP